MNRPIATADFFMFETWKQSYIGHLQARLKSNFQLIIYTETKVEAKLQKHNSFKKRNFVGVKIVIITL